MNNFDLNRGALRILSEVSLTLGYLPMIGPLTYLGKVVMEGPPGNVGSGPPPPASSTKKYKVFNSPSLSRLPTNKPPSTSIALG